LREKGQSTHHSTWLQPTTIAAFRAVRRAQERAVGTVTRRNAIRATVTHEGITPAASTM
jgi:hypothetical protein